MKCCKIRKSLSLIDFGANFDVMTARLNTTEFFSRRSSIPCPIKKIVDISRQFTFWTIYTPFLTYVENITGNRKFKVIISAF